MVESKNPPKLKDLFPEFSNFSQQLVVFLDELEISEQVKDLAMDHFCIRLSTLDQVNDLLAQMQENGSKLINTTEVNGRNIHLLELSEVETFGLWQTKYLEVPEPKSGQKYHDGPEHVEFVLETNAPTITDLQAIFAKFFPNLTQQQLTKYNYRTELPNTPINQTPNPTICLTRNELTIKFHPKALSDIVTSK